MHRGAGEAGGRTGRLSNTLVATWQESTGGCLPWGPAGLMIVRWQFSLLITFSTGVTALLFPFHCHSFAEFPCLPKQAACTSPAAPLCAPMGKRKPPGQRGGPVLAMTLVSRTGLAVNVRYRAGAGVRKTRRIFKPSDSPDLKTSSCCRAMGFHSILIT